MSRPLAIDVKGYTNFACSIAVGSRPFLRLLNSACLWVQEIAKKTNIMFLGYELDIKVLSTGLLKPLDNQIYIIKAINEILDVQEKCFDRLFSIEVSDSAAGLRCFAFFGVMVLTPHIQGLTLTKNFLGASAGLLDLAMCIRDLLKLVYRPIKTDEEERKAQYEWLGHMLMVGAYVSSMQLNFFGGCKTLFKDVVKPENHIPGALFNIWGTTASFCILGNIAVEYFSPK